MRKTKKLLSVLLALAIIIAALPVLPFTTIAETEGLFTYTVSGDEATITQFNDTSYAGDLIIPSTLGGHTVTKIDDYVFRGCTGLTSIVIPDSVTSIGWYAFSSTGLISIVVPDSVKSLGWSVFNNCKSLKSLHIGKGVTYIDDAYNQLAGCDSLESITIDSENPVYHADGNCIIKTKTKTLTFGCGNSIIPVNGSVTSIGSFAFSGIVINSISVPLSIVSINIFAFDACSISEVYYYGTLDQWQAINIGDYNEPLIKAKKHYICDTVGHDYIADVVEADCLHGGYTTYTCSRCGDSHTGDYTAPTGHKCDEWTITKNATCKVEGERVGVCKFCGTAMQETIPTVSHAYDAWRYDVLPSCEQNGRIICTCLLCGDKKTITIDALGHEYSSAWTIDSEPTCTAAGQKSHHCIRCDAVSGQTEIPATGHNYTTVTVEPTCTKGGYTSHICSVCGSSYKTDIVSASGHTFTHTSARAATCTEIGWNEYDTCDICGYTTYEEIDTLGHDYQEIANGYICSRCDAVIENTQAVEHHFVKTIVRPTEQADGYTQYTCLDCGYYYRTDETHFQGGAKLSVSSMVTGAGKKVVLTVSIKDNPGIYSFTLDVNYDKSSMTLSSIKNLNKLSGDLSLGADKVLWLNNSHENSTYNGEIFQLIFDVSALTTAQDYEVSLNYSAGSIVNYQLNDVNFAFESGVVTVEGFTAGDINGDGVCNNKDLILMSEVFARNYTAYKKGKAHTENNRIRGFNLFGNAGMNILKDIEIVVLGVTIERVALDINNDGAINNYDLLTMMKYLRGEEIEIL